MVDSVSGAWAALSSRVWSLAAKIVYLCVKTFMIAFRAAKCVFAFGEASQPTTIEGGRELTRAKYNFVASIYDVVGGPGTAGRPIQTAADSNMTFLQSPS